MSRYSESFSLFSFVELIMENSVKFEIWLLKTTCRDWRSPHEAKFGHLMLCFTEDGKQIYQEL